MRSVKDAINDLVNPGKADTALPVRPEKSPIVAAVGVATPDSAAAKSGLVSPLQIKITATVKRSIPVPAGATSVDVEDAASFTLTDAAGNVYKVTDITWP